VSETSPPFARTTCACPTCVQCCRDQPGPLRPGDFERIAAHLGETPAQAAAHFWASPGAVAMDTRTGRQFRIGTITPQRVGGRCVFLDAQDRCGIHAVAPFGCAYHDTHQSTAEGQRRSAWAMRLVHGDRAYQALRQSLPPATSYRPRRAY
jgi:Fe-S-cluster containining protein